MVERPTKRSQYSSVLSLSSVRSSPSTTGRQRPATPAPYSLRFSHGLRSFRTAS